MGAVLALVLLVYFVWSPSCASRKTCADLKADSGGGWPTVHGGIGAEDASVCGESDDGLGPGGSKQCYGGTNSNANDKAQSAVAGQDPFAWREGSRATDLHYGWRRRRWR